MKFGGIFGNDPSVVTARGRKINLHDGQQAIWVDTADMKKARTDCDFVWLPDGRVCAVGGSTSPERPQLKGTAVLEPEYYNPEQNVWTLIPFGMTKTRMYHSTAQLLPDGSVLTAGGDYLEVGDPELKPEFNGQIFYPDYLMIDSLRPVITSTKPAQVMQYNNMLTIDTNPNDIVAKVTLLGLGSTTHSYDMNQRFIRMTINQQSPGEIIVYTPKNPGIAPPGYYMLFVIGPDGIPSMAKYMKIG
ncbi:MAG: DUF1929 domain-containing protein [Armatimonadetes bacterium]|nr:DUF1929 domain-containing protein [Armatimonadota bacterium]